MQLHGLMKRVCPLAFALLAAVQAQSNISPTAKHAHAANAGWIDLRPSGSTGLQVHDGFVGGNAYAANFGWINFGNGQPANGFSYTNNSATDFGLNLGSGGALNGYAYSANVGWINFEQIHGKPRIDLLTGIFSGFAYSGNVGWIDLGSSGLKANSLVRADTDADGLSDTWEMQYFSSLTVANSLTDQDGDGLSDLAEYQAGSNPLLSGSRFEIISRTIDPVTGLASLSFRSSPDRLYRVMHGPSLQSAWSASSPAWLPGDSGEVTTRSLNFPASSRHFFRVESSLPLEP